MSRVAARPRRLPTTGLPPESFATHDELLARHRRRTPYVQDALAVDFDADADAYDDLDDDEEDDLVRRPRPTPRADLPDPHLTAAHLAQAVVEVVSGTRSPVQLLRCTAPEVYAVLARRGMLAHRRAAMAGAQLQRRRPAVVRRVLVCEPADGVAEATAIVVDAGRIRALAMRLVGYDGGWRLTVVQLG